MVFAEFFEPLFSLRFGVEFQEPVVFESLDDVDSLRRVWLEDSLYEVDAGYRDRLLAVRVLFDAAEHLIQDLQVELVLDIIDSGVLDVLVGGTAEEDLEDAAAEREYVYLGRGRLPGKHFRGDVLVPAVFDELIAVEVSSHLGELWIDQKDLILLLARGKNDIFESQVAVVVADSVEVFETLQDVEHQGSYGEFFEVRLESYLL